MYNLPTSDMKAPATRKKNRRLTSTSITVRLSTPNTVPTMLKITARIVNTKHTVIQPEKVNTEHSVIQPEIVNTKHPLIQPEIVNTITP